MDDPEDDWQEWGPLTEYVIEQGKKEPVTLRDHLDVLRTYADRLYEHHAQSALESLDPEELAMVPEEVEEEESPYCVVYYLPNGKLIRILPEYPFELQTWEMVDEEEEEQELEAADLLRVFNEMEHDPELLAALLDVARVCKRVADRRVQQERLRFMAGGKDDA